MQNTHYEILGVPEDASDEEIRKAYRRAILQAHPDLHQNDPEAGQRARELNAAFIMLTDAEARRKYDAKLRRQREAKIHKPKPAPQPQGPSLHPDLMRRRPNLYDPPPGILTNPAVWITIAIAGVLCFITVMFWRSHDQFLSLFSPPDLESNSTGVAGLGPAPTVTESQTIKPSDARPSTDQPRPTSTMSDFLKSNSNNSSPPTTAANGTGTDVPETPNDQQIEGSVNTQTNDETGDSSSSSADSSPAESSSALDTEDPMIVENNDSSDSASNLSSPPQGISEQESEERYVAEAAKKGREFLVSLVDADTNLLPEYPGSSVYWLFDDNYLAHKALKESHPEVSRAIEQAILSHGVRRSGKIEILFDEADLPLPFRLFKIVDVRQTGLKTFKTVVREEKVLEGWEVYADLHQYAAIVLADSEPQKARQNLNVAVGMWDRYGFRDRPAKMSQRYVTFKLALHLIAEKKLGTESKIQRAVLKNLLAMQNSEGGWIGEYDSKGNRSGVPTVFTTTLAILALDSFAAP